MADISVIGIGNVGKLVINKIAEYNNKVQTIYKILGEELNKLIVTDCDLIIKDIYRKTSIKEAFELVAEILYSNLQDTFRKVEMKYQKVIVDHNEKCEEIKKREMEKKKISQELGNTCCLMMKKRKIREE